jgi:hypothetical protein
MTAATDDREHLPACNPEPHEPHHDEHGACPGVLEPELQHELLVHLQWHHAAMPPYQGTPVEAHAWLHEDAAELMDTDHARDEVTLPPRHQYPTRGPRTYRSDRLGMVTIPEGR